MDTVGQSDEQKLMTLSEKAKRLLQWFLTEAVPVIDAEDDWKIIIHSRPRGDTKAIIERHKII